MGKLILCSGTVATEPFHLKLTNTKVYSIEELCYYIYHNIYIISEELFDETMVDWLKEQVKMEDISVKLKTMIENHNSLKDIVVSILCSADYYDEEEIQKLIVIMDEIENLVPVARNKIKADNYLKYKNYSRAKKEYEKMLNQKEAIALTTEEYGNIQHNLAIAYIHTASYKEAALQFKEAYSRNHNEESLKQYLFALKLGRFEEELSNEVVNYQVSDDLFSEYKNELDALLEEAEHLPLFKKIERLSEMKKEGKVADYYNKIGQLITTWEDNYKKEVG